MNRLNQREASLRNKPVVGVCGYSGSGKTTLLESLVRHYVRKGLTVAVIKHDAHRLMPDVPGKDTARMYDAGASVLAHDASQIFCRRPASDAVLPRAIRTLLSEHDLVFVEGHKQTPLPVRLWMSSRSDNAVPSLVGRVDANLAWDSDRVEAATRFVDAHLMRCFIESPLYGGIFMGGDSTRMGRPKQLLALDGKCFAEHIAGILSANVETLLLLGRGPIPPTIRDLPTLPDAPDRVGPIGGLCAAFRWMPAASWIFSPCDTPLISHAAVTWLLSNRKPGIWAVMPKAPDTGQIEPLLAWYDPRMLSVLADVRSPIVAAGHAKVLTPAIPRRLCAAWRNVNTQEEMRLLEEELRRSGFEMSGSSRAPDPTR